MKFWVALNLIWNAVFLGYDSIWLGRYAATHDSAAVIFLVFVIFHTVFLGYWLHLLRRVRA
jgi:hypothetical protein